MEDFRTGLQYEIPITKIQEFSEFVSHIVTEEKVFPPQTTGIFLNPFSTDSFSFWSPVCIFSLPTRLPFQDGFRGLH